MITLLRGILGLEPKSHTERFAVFRLHYRDLYKVVNRYFDFYRDAYERRITKREVGGVEECGSQACQ